MFPVAAFGPAFLCLCYMIFQEAGVPGAARQAFPQLLLGCPQLAGLTHNGAECACIRSGFF